MTSATGGSLSAAALVLACLLPTAAASQAAESARTQPPFEDLDPELAAELPPLEPPDLEAPTLPVGGGASDLDGVDPLDATPALETPTDSEIAAPLTPLADFDVVTREPLSSASDEGPAAVSYAVSAVGMPTAELASRFDDLSVLRENRSDPAPLSQISARMVADVELIERLLRSEGYYDGRVDPVMAPDASDSGATKVTLNITPGERYVLDDIVVTGPGTTPPELARSALSLSRSDPVVAAEVLAAEANVTLRLPEQGYPFATVGQRDILLDPPTATADYTLPVSPGPRGRFGTFRLEGDQVFDAAHVGVIARFDRGELYDQRKVDDLRRALVATSLFSSIGVTPVRTGEAQADQTEAVDLLVQATAAPPRTLAGSIGYGSGEGARIEATWTHRNLFPPEGALTLRGVAGTKEQRLGVQLRRSNWGKRDRSLQLLAEASRERRDESFDADGLTLSARIARESTPIWRKTWTYAVGGELTATAERARQDTPLQTYYIAAIPGQVGYDRSNDLLNPTEGFRLAGRLSPEVSFRNGTTPYVRGFMDASGYLPVGGSLVMAVRGHVASIVGAERTEIAPSRRLYGGGGGSVRGYGYRELGPVTADGERVGGRSLVEMSVEARYRFGNFGIVPFFDVGQAYEGSVPKFSDLRYGVGIGARYYTNFGPIRLDVARGLSRRSGDPKFAVYISIGQAF